MHTRIIDVEETRYICDVCGFTSGYSYNVEFCEAKHALEAKQAICEHSFIHGLEVDTNESYRHYDAIVEASRVCTKCGYRSKIAVDVDELPETITKQIYSFVLGDDE